MADELISTKPYMARAIHEWCIDNGLTPHLLVAVNERTRVPKAFVKDGEIVLNINYSATQNLTIDNDAVVFSARFGGVSHNMYVPMDAVRGVYARENGQGMFFEIDAQESAASPVDEVEKAADVAPEEGESKGAKRKKRPNLTIVK